MTLVTIEDKLQARFGAVTARRVFQVLGNYRTGFIHLVSYSFRKTGHYSVSHAREKHDELVAMLAEVSTRSYCTKRRLKKFHAELGYFRNQLEFLEKFRFVGQQ